VSASSEFLLWYQPRVKFRSPLTARLIILEAIQLLESTLKEEEGSQPNTDGYVRATLSDPLGQSIGILRLI
jgi:hypothetical protein